MNERIKLNISITTATRDINLVASRVFRSFSLGAIFMEIKMEKIKKQEKLAYFYLESKFDHDYKLMLIHNEIKRYNCISPAIDFLTINDILHRATEITDMEEVK